MLSTREKEERYKWYKKVVLYITRKIKKELYKAGINFNFERLKEIVEDACFKFLEYLLTKPEIKFSMLYKWMNVRARKKVNEALEERKRILSVPNLDTFKGKI